MKKILFILCLISSALFSQNSGYRYGIIPEGGGYYQVPNKEIQTVTYASTRTITTTHEATKVVIGELTGALTLSSTVTDCYSTDRLTILFSADATNRVVTFSTGFSSRGTLTVLASGTATIEFIFNGTAWLEVSRQNLQPTAGMRTATTYTANATVTAAELAGGILTIGSGTLTLTLPTATLAAPALGATTGSTFEFVLNNTGTAGTATIAVGSGIVASGFPSTNTLTLANSATIGIAVFRLTFISATAATLTRIN